MKSMIASVFLAALVGLAQAKVILTNTTSKTSQVGKPFQITWADAQGPVTVTLKTGTETDLKTVSQIASGSTSGSASWTPGTDLSGNYAFEITDGVDINYSQMFTLDGTPSATSATGSSTAGYSATTASTLSTITTASSSSASSTGSATTSSASSGSASFSAPISASPSSSAAASSSSPASSSASASASATSTRSSSTTSASATSSSTATPNNNDARGVVAPIFAPLLVALGAALL